MTQATVLRPGQYRHLLRVTEATSRDPERDILVLLLGIHVGMRFSDIARGAGPSIKVIMAILSSRCITTNWEGPCPEQEFYKAGRAYRLRTSRRGPIGGRAVASHLPPERS